jgi:SAM-dependent methyltransferase
VVEQLQIEAIRTLYSKMEPPDCDAWSPLHKDLELHHRVRLTLEACRALRRIPKQANQLMALDVGCGVGRSGRLLVELGIPPDNILGIDVRDSAIEFARRVNPAIRYRALHDLTDWPLERFDLCIQCTVFSSIPGIELREETARLMDRSVSHDGYIFWWDTLIANGFAGGDRLDPLRFFPNRAVLYSREVSLLPEISDAIRPLRGMGRILSALLKPCGHEATHLAALFGPKA